MFSIHFCNLHQILNIFKQKMIFLATFFRKLRPVKDLVRPLFKKHRFRNSFDNQHVKESQSLVKSASEHFHHIFSALSKTLIWKISHLVISSILGLFRNTLTTNDNYPVEDSANFLSPIGKEFYLKPTIFSDFFVSFLESTSNFKHFEKKDDCHSYFIWEIRHCERVG